MSSIINFLVILTIAISSLAILFFLLKLINVNTKNINWQNINSGLNEYMRKLDETVKTSVVATNQTLVNPLKESNSFSQLDKEEAFESCKEKIYRSIKDVSNEMYNPYLGNLDEWINSRIEYYVKLNKSNT